MCIHDIAIPRWWVDTTSIPLANGHLDHLLNMECEQVLVEITQQYALFFTLAYAFAHAYIDLQIFIYIVRYIYVYTHNLIEHIYIV
jgi:hypothetical protein